MIFENRDLLENTVQAEPSNCDTEHSQKVHSFEQQTCQGLEIWNAPRMFAVIKMNVKIKFQ